MQTFTLPPQLPPDTLPGASMALKRLSELNARLRAELDQLPAAEGALLDAIIDQDTNALHRHKASLLQDIDNFWATSTAPGENRYALFLAAMRQGLRDELSLKHHERNIGAQHIDCLPPPASPAGQPTGPVPENFSMQVQLQDELWVEVAGALAMAHPQGHVLLVLPGVGAMGFTSKTDMAQTLMQWLNVPASKHALIKCMSLRSQDWLAAFDNDPDVYIEPFSSADLRLQPVTGDPFVHALESLLNKQRDDVAHACSAAPGTDRKHLQALIRHAISLQGLPDPSAMLELRELAYLESRYRQSLPDWIKTASKRDMQTYNQRLSDHDQARETMLSALGAAASPEMFAATQLSARIANDLGYAIDPHALKVSTQRTLPLTHETYTVSRSLVELALYGLHPGDSKAGSAFLARTTLTLEGEPLGEAHAALTPKYLAALVEELDLRLNFAGFQREAYGNAQHQQLINTLTHRQINVLASAAHMQGHLRAEDFATVEACMESPTPGPNVAIQQIRLEGHLMGKLMLFCKRAPSGQADRLILFAADKPEGNNFKAFDTRAQLLHELVGWTASNESSDYLLKQVEAGPRGRLAQTFSALRLKPYPQENFLQLEEVADLGTSLQRISDEHIRLALLEQQLHTPDWYRRASHRERQQLLELEDAAAGANANYQAKSHTRLQPFNAYVHDRASTQISRLLNRPVGEVDPDQIVITSERETVSYTHMLLNGYDDSIDFTRTSAATQATFSGPEGIDLSALSPERVAASVRGKWLGDDYIALIRATLLDAANAGYAYRRTASVMMTQLQMSAAALRSRLKGDIDAPQYAWLKTSIEHAHLSDADHRRRYPLYPLQIHVDKPFIGSGLPGVDDTVIPSPLLTHVETVQGCVVILPTTTRLAALLYTPQAPDGVELRLFADFVDSLKKPGMIDYYKDRCRIKSRQTLSFFLHDMAQGKANKPPVIPREAITDFADVCFNRPLERALRDVKETTNSRNEMLARLIWTTVELVATVVTLPFPPASFAVGVLLAMHDTVRAFKALRDGGSDAAAAHVLASMLNSLGAAGDLHTGLKGFGGALQRLDRSAQPEPLLRPLLRQGSLPRYEDLYPVNLKQEPFLRGQPSVSGHAPIYRFNPDSHQVNATGKFAARTENGTWQALDLQPARAPAQPATNPDLSVRLSLRDVPRIKEGHATGVQRINGMTYIELGDKTWQVQFDAQLRCWQIVDPANPFAFFGKQPVRLGADGQWQLLARHQLRGGGLDTPGSYTPLLPEGAGNAPPDIAAYEMPPRMRQHIPVILDTKPHDPLGMDLEEYFETYYAPMRKTFSELREKLYRDAGTFFNAPTLPPRPTLPVLAADETVDTLLTNVFSHSKGLVLSEAPKSVASKRLLITHMPLLVEQRVEILYIEHLFSDKHLPKLARYRQLGMKTRSGSREIKHHLASLNDGALNNQTSEYDYYHLIKTAHRHGIEVRPFNSSVSYPLLDHPVASAADDAQASRKMSLFFGHKLISSDTAAEPTRRWIALLDQNLATSQGTAPGIAELQGAISVRIKDVPVGRPTRIKARSRVASADANAPCDVTIEHANPLLLADASSLPPSTLLDRVLLHDLGRQSAAGELWAGDYGFRWDDVAGWSRIEPDDWNAASPPTAIQQSLADPTYEMPNEQRSVLHQLANFESRGLDGAYLMTDPQLSSGRNHFFKLRDALKREAQKVIAADLPGRPILAQVQPQTSLPEFLEHLYRNTDGVVIGETHSSVASKKLIIDNLPLLAEQNVKTLYMEHLLTDLHQADLDRFFETGEMSKTLLHDLKKMDRGHHTDADKVYNFERLVVKAQQQGLEIRAIDCAASYHLKGVSSEAPTTRQQMMNYFAARTLQRHQEVMGSHKWIALVGNSHSNTFQGIVPGIAELTGSIGLRVTDVAPGQARAIMVDPGELVRVGISNQKVPIKGDYLIEMEVAKRSASIRPPQPLAVEDRLSRPGMFLIESNADVQTVVHRSRDALIHRTPVQVNTQGKLYISRPAWSAVHLTPFDDMDALVSALEELNLTRVA